MKHPDRPDAKVIVGAGGQLGNALREIYPEAISLTSRELDITDSERVGQFNWSGFDTILNAAAYTAVDAAETPEGQKKAWDVNVTAVQNLARVALKHNATLVHVSSDYVFDGSKLLHDENEAFSPLSIYGKTKAAGDIAASLAVKHYVVRTSWVIGHGNNFVRTIKSLADKRIKPNVVDDQFGRLTFAHTLAAGIEHLLNTKADFGTYNLTNEGPSTSWADIAKRVFELSGASESDVTGVTTADYYPNKTGIAPRPLQSTLDLTKIEATGFQPSDWRDELRTYMQQL